MDYWGSESHLIPMLSYLSVSNSQQTNFFSGRPLGIFIFHLSTKTPVYSKLLLQLNINNELRQISLSFLVTKFKKQPTYALRPVITNNTCPLRFTAAAGTKFARASSLGIIIILPNKWFYGYMYPSSPTRCRWVKLALIAQNSLLLPLIGLISVPLWRISLLSPAISHRLGKLLSLPTT